MSAWAPESVIRRCRLNVRITPKSGHVADIPDRQLRAQADLCIAAIGVVIQRADRVCRPHEGLRHAVAPRLGSRRTCPAPPPCRSREAPLWYARSNRNFNYIRVRSFVLTGAP